MAETSVTPSPDVADAPLESDASTETDKTIEQSTPKHVISHFRQQIATAKSHRRQFSQEWKRNVDLRLGRIAQINTNGYPITDGDDLQTEINPDWYLTKTKTANLYSQTPQVQLSHENEQYAQAVPPFAKALNYELGEKRSNVGVPMEESLNDVVNASGIAGIMVGYIARFEEVPMPSMNVSGLSAEQQAALTASGQLQTLTAKRVTSYKFDAKRVSPTNLLWPAAFTGMDFNDADWIGHTDELGWASAKIEFKLTDDDKSKVVSGTQKDTQDDLRAQPERGQLMAFEAVKFDEIFYWRYRVDPEEKDLKAIWRMVFVHGIDDRPVIDERWIGQVSLQDQPTKFVGATKYPIQICTLTYVTDNPVPPSDSAAARPQVNDLRRSRSQYFQNRVRSRPVRWFDVNRIDRTIQDNLMRGDYQGFIPTNGPGDRAIGEIARANYPQEDLAFDRQTTQDLHAMWMIGQNQLGGASSGERTAAEIETIQANFNTRIGQERALVQKYFLNVVEVLAGLMALYSDFPNLTDQEKQQMMSAWNNRQVLADLAFKIRPDSTVLLDAGQRIERLTKFLNITAKSGVVDIVPIITEIAELSGVDPARVMKQPQPPQPEQASISFRFSGKEDLQNPGVVAILAHNKQLPDPKDMQAAEQFLHASQQGVQNAQSQIQSPQPQQPTNGEPGAPEDYTLAPKVAQRADDMRNAA